MYKKYIQLRIIGITYNKVERGVYALIMQEVDGTRRVPIVIGMAEAQSIECCLQNIITPRPLTHDLLINIMRAYNINLEGVVIKLLDGGIFAADLQLSDGTQTHTIDSRSSDAIAIALRMGVPIYTTEDLLDSLGYSNASGHVNSSESGVNSNLDDKPEDMASWVKKANTLETKELEDLLNKCVEEEEYERAAAIKAIISSRSEK